MPCVRWSAQSARLTHTVDTLLAVARRELDPTEGAVDLAALVREVDDVEVIASRATCRSPRANLTSCAARWHRSWPTPNGMRVSGVRLELSAGEGRVRITVRDDGLGLDPGLGERAFDPGVRGPEERLARRGPRAAARTASCALVPAVTS